MKWFQVIIIIAVYYLVLSLLHYSVCGKFQLKDCSNSQCIEEAIK